MNAAQVIAEKRDGKPLADDSIEFLVKGYASGEIPDYQMAAFAMAVYFQGMSESETTTFTRCMLESGDQMKWPAKPPAVDKHSTGGIGDKVSIPLAPLLACCGVVVPMISGRGLGATGGTLDKLESIPGYRTEMSVDEFRSVVNFCGCSIVSASDTLAPADKRLYALRDVTATVPSIPLITASILSKKIAAGNQALVLDVKWGSGAFMKTLEQARELSRSLVSVGNQLGLKTTAVVTDMNQPLGYMIGNALEVDESVQVLKGDGPADVTELMLELAARLLQQAGVCSSNDQARVMLQEKIDSGEAYQRLVEMVKAHGGDLEQQRVLASKKPVLANETGFLSRVNAERLGLAVIEMGGGRKKLGDPIDHSTGIEFLLKIGDPVENGQPIANVFCDGPKAEYVNQLVSAAIGVSPVAVDRLPLIAD